MSEPAIVPFDPEAHGPFVYDSFRNSVQKQWPWRMMAPYRLLADLKHTLASPDTRTLVAVSPEDADAYLGWCCAVPRDNCIVFAFTKYAYRREFGVGSTLALACGIDLTRETGVRYWTRAAERISRRPGYHLVADFETMEAAA